MVSTCPWKTKVATSYFKTDEKTAFPFKILLSNPNNERYVYKLEYNNKEYILKGFTFFLPHRHCELAKYIAQMEKVLYELQGVYGEYYLTKSASMFSSHFCKPLNIDHKLEIFPDELNESSAYIVEILQEYGGKSLDTFANRVPPLSLPEIFNFMYQSAHGLALLHHTGTAHLDLKPANIVYDKSNDLLKVIDLGISTSASQSIRLHSGTISFENKIRGLTVEYAAPEVLKRLYDPYVEFKYIISSIDVYCWAATFYSLLMRKAKEELEREAIQFKSKSEIEYKPWIKRVQEELKEIKVKNSEEKEIIAAIQESVVPSLEFEPEKRPKFVDLITRMRSHIMNELPYEKRACDERKKISEKIAGKNADVNEHYKKLQAMESEIAAKDIKIAKLENQLNSERMKYGDDIMEIAQVKQEKENLYLDISRISLENRALKSELNLIKGIPQKKEQESEELKAKNNELSNQIKTKVSSILYVI